MRRQHLDELVVIGRRGLEVRRGGQVADAPLPLGQRVVGDSAHQILQEPVLAVLGGARVGLDRQHLLAHERRQHRVVERRIVVCERRERPLRERLAEHGAVLDDAALVGREPVQAGGDQRVQGLRHLQGVHGAGRPVDAPLLHQVAAVEQHAHGLDGVQRHALGAGQDLPREGIGQPRHEAVEQRPHRRLGQRLQIERREVALPRSPRGAPLDELRPGGGDDVEGRVPRPLEQMLDEVEQRRVGPLHVLEGQHRRIDVGQPLEEHPPGREQVFALEPGAALHPQQMRDPRLDERALVGVLEVRVQHVGELCERRVGRIVLADPAPHPHHVGQRPVGHALAVGRTPAPVPVDHLGEAVEVLVELPHQPRLADPGDAGDRHEMGAALVGAGVEQVLDLAQLALAADERRLQALRLERPARARDDPHRPPQPVQADLALELVLAGILEDHRRLGRAPGRVAHEHPPRLGQGLHPRGAVHDIARHHALADGADGDGRLTGQHAGADAQVGDADLVAERAHGGDQVERGPHRPLGVVLGGVVRSPDGHDGVADELLHHPAVELDQAAADVEVA